MGQEIKKRSIATDPVVRKLLEGAIKLLDSEERLIMLYPEYHERVRKQRGERRKRDPLADAW